MKPDAKNNNTSQLKVNSFIKKLQSKTCDELDKADLLDALSGFPEMYGEKYKKKYGHYPGEKPKT